MRTSLLKEDFSSNVNSLVFEMSGNVDSTLTGQDMFFQCIEGGEKTLFQVMTLRLFVCLFSHVVILNLV